MGRTAGQAVERGSRLETDGDGGSAREVDNLLEPWAAGALRDEDAVQGVVGAKGFGHGVNAAEDGHRKRYWPQMNTDKHG
jgi:hypothetical protein